MRIGFVGAGGIGGYLAAKLITAGEDVRVLARGVQLDAIRANGLRLMDPDGDLHVTPEVSDDAAVLQGTDAIVMSVKAHQLEAAVAQIAPVVGAETLVVPFQNGVEAPDLVAKGLGPERSAIGTAKILVNITAPGELTRYGTANDFIMCGYDGTPEPLDPLRERFRHAGITVPRMPDGRVALWEKFVLFNAMSCLTAGARLRIGQMRHLPEIRALAKRMMEETAAVGRAEGVALRDTLIDEHLKLMMEIMPAASRASTAHDLADGRALEIDYLAGAVVRLGQKHGLDVSATETAYALLRPWRDGPPPPVT